MKIKPTATKNRAIVGALFAALTLFACNPGPENNLVDLEAGVTPVPTMALEGNTTPDSEQELIEATQVSLLLLPDDPHAGLVRSVSVFPDGASFTWNLIVSGFEGPTFLAAPNDGSGRLFVGERLGQVWVWQDGQVSPTPYIDLSPKMTAAGPQQGLWNMTFDPAFAESGLVYLLYTDLAGSVAVSQFGLNEDGTAADRNTIRVLLSIRQPGAEHNGRGLAFSPDGNLYVALGDGGIDAEDRQNAQAINSLLGKLLRIIVDPDQRIGYTVPAKNPFYGSLQGRFETWGVGLQNPGQISFDSASDDLFVPDSSNNQINEINFLHTDTAGVPDFGWSFFEGTTPFGGTAPSLNNIIIPIYEYAKTGPDCQVIGGYIYRGAALPQFDGIYVFADSCSGQIMGLLQSVTGNWQMAVLATLPGTISGFGQDADGELYALTAQGGVYKLEPR